MLQTITHFSSRTHQHVGALVDCYDQLELNNEANDDPTILQHKNSTPCETRSVQKCTRNAHQFKSEIVHLNWILAPDTQFQKRPIDGVGGRARFQPRDALERYCSCSRLTKLTILLIAKSNTRTCHGISTTAAEIDRSKTLSFRLHPGAGGGQNADAGDSNQKVRAESLGSENFVSASPGAADLGNASRHHPLFGRLALPKCDKISRWKRIKLFSSLICIMPLKENHFSTSWFFRRLESSSLDIFRCSDTVKRRAGLFVRAKTVGGQRTPSETHRCVIKHFFLISPIPHPWNWRYRRLWH